MDLILKYNAETGYWIVRNERGESLFASESRRDCKDFALDFQMDRRIMESPAYLNWLAAQDAKFQTCEYDV
jgi:hypothetical protein